MNVLKQYYFFCLIAINCFTFFAYQEVPTVIFHVDSFQSEPSRSNIKYGIRTEYNILSYDQSEYYAPYHKEYYASFSTQDFQQAFQDISDINEILNQYPLYAFKNFLEFARPFPEYEIHIILLYEKIKNDKTFRKQTASMPYFTYSFGLRHEKSGFHDFVATEAQRIISIQQQRKISKTQQTMYSMPQDGDVLAEYTALSNLGKDHPPCLSLALKKRVKAIKSMIRCDHALQYINKSYDLNDNVKQLLKKYGYDITCFTQSYGHHLRHTIHQESLDLLNRIDTLSSDSILYDHQEALVDFTVAMANYNHENETDKALHIGDFCWTLLDYGQAIAEGIVLGAYSAATDLLHNPLEASLNIIIGKQVLAYQLCKVLFNVADISITALISTDQAKNKWYKYTEPLNNIINHINEKNLSMRDLLKGGTAFIVGYKAQSTFFNGLGKFCNTIQQKATRFAQNNVSSFTIQQYLATPEGYLLRSTAKTSHSSCPNQYEKLKQWLQIKEFTSLINTTQHGIERLIERGFTPKDISDLLCSPSFTKLQNNGAIVYIKQIKNNFNVMTLNPTTKKVVTALKNIDQQALDNLGKNYGWQ